MGTGQGGGRQGGMDRGGPGRRDGEGKGVAGCGRDRRLLSPATGLRFGIGITTVAALCAALSAGTGAAQEGQRAPALGPAPAEEPPADYTASQYIDSLGCAYIRAGAATWAARLNAEGTPLCGFKPTFEPPAEPVPVIKPVVEPEPPLEAVPVIEPVVEPAAPLDAVPVIEPVVEPEPTLDAVPVTEPVVEPAPESGAEAALPAAPGAAVEGAAAEADAAVAPVEAEPSAPADAASSADVAAPAEAAGETAAAETAPAPAAPLSAAPAPLPDAPEVDPSPFAAPDPAAVPESSLASVLPAAPAQDARPEGTAPPTSARAPAPGALAAAPDPGEGVPSVGTAAPPPPASEPAADPAPEAAATELAAAADKAPASAVDKVPSAAGAVLREASAPARAQATHKAGPPGMSRAEACAGRSGLQPGLVDRRTGRPVVCGPDPEGGDAAAAVPADAPRLTLSEICADIRATGRRYIRLDGDPVDCPEAGPAAGSAKVAELVPAKAAAAHRYVQVGAFAQEGNAARSLSRLRALGLPVAQTRATVGGQRLRVVLAGPFDDPAALAAALRAVRAEGFADAFTRR